MAGLIAAQIAFRQSLQWRIFSHAGQVASTAETVSISLAIFYRWQGILSLLAQCLLVPLVFRFVNLRVAIYLQPSFGILAIACAALATDASFLMGLIALYSSLDYTVNNCVRESFFITHSTATKIFAKSWLAILLPKVGSMIGSATLLMVNVFGLASWYIWGAIFCVGGLLAARRLAALQRGDRNRQWVLQESVDEAASHVAH